MPNLSQSKRERMLAFLQKIKDEHRDDDDMLIALGEIESELTSKKYGLVWEQHEEAVDVMMRDNIPVFTEVPEREITAAPGQRYNFILEGDNLHALHLLTKTHRGKIDVIYIDPPYNTKNKDFIYDDKRIDSSDGFQHSKWISFMAERLRIAGDLLSKNGIMAISIGYHEVNNLMMLCQEMFSTKNVVCVTVQTSSGNAVQNGCVWRLIPEKLKQNWDLGYIKVVPNKKGKNKYTIQYLSGGIIEQIEEGELETYQPDKTIPTLEVEVVN